MNHTLDYTPEEFQNILQQTSALILEQYKNIDSIKGFHSHPQKEVESWFDEPLPLNGKDTADLLKRSTTKSN